MRSLARKIISMIHLAGPGTLARKEDVLTNILWFVFSTGAAAMAVFLEVLILLGAIGS